MSDRLLLAPMPVIHPWSAESLGDALATNAMPLSAAASAVYPSAGVAIYVPFLVTEPRTAQQLWIYNGATVGNGTADVGIYDRDGHRLVSATATTTAGANALQVFNTTDILLPPARYFLAIALSSALDTLFSRAPNAELLRALGCYQEASASTLPATATMATIAQAYMPVFGLVFRSVI